MAEAATLQVVDGGARNTVEDGKIDYVEAGIIDENRMTRAIRALVR